MTDQLDEKEKKDVVEPFLKGWKKIQRGRKNRIRRISKKSKKAK